ncbi:hypothetical protein HNP81_002896 [Peribacillus huizhouensis]|uniref:Uncharacterized protein n=1 Tax=Peribacillus huizhouensis TaxID=1501239 RepID=A0ABR6CSA0_9BACI|nr:hypothetical protein [Peribacillus huizhouensis]
MITKRKNPPKKQNETKNGKESLVITRNPKNYTSFDIRANKPNCYKYNALYGETGSMVLQEVKLLNFKQA